LVNAALAAASIPVFEAESPGRAWQSNRDRLKSPPLLLSDIKSDSGDEGVTSGRRCTTPSSGAIIDSMAEARLRQLVVRGIDDRVVRKLKERAGRRGVSMEEEHRRILREALLRPARKTLSFKEYLRQMPEGGPDALFERSRDTGRTVDL
jgi:plasmid stability protein